MDDHFPVKHIKKIKNRAKIAPKVRKSKTGKTLGRPRLVGESDLAATMEAAAGRDGLPIEVLRVAKREGCAAFRSNGNVSMKDLRAWLVERPEFTKTVMAIPNPEIELALERRASRLMKEHKLAVARGEFVAVSHVRMALTRMIVSAKAKILGAVPGVFAVSGPRLGVAPGVLAPLETELTGKLREALAEMAKGEWAMVKCECGREVG